MAKRGSHNPYDAYRKEAYENIASQNHERIPDLLNVFEEIKRLLPAPDATTYAAALLDTAAWSAVLAEDDQRTSPSQQSMLPGWPDPEDDFWKLGDGERVKVAAATAQDHVLHIQLVDANASKVSAAASAARAKYYRLAPYYLGGARTVAEAAAAWHRDNP